MASQLIRGPALRRRHGTGRAYRVLAPEAYVQVKAIIERRLPAGWSIQLAPATSKTQVRKYLDLYVRGSGGVSAVERVKLMAAMGCRRFRVRWPHELRSQLPGSHEIRRYALFGTHRISHDRWKASRIGAWPDARRLDGTV
jgi:aromatic ring hydroxylase